MDRTEAITSASNPLLKQVRKASTRGELTASGFCVAEGFHLLDEALRSRLPIDAVLAAESAKHELKHRLKGLALRLITLPDPLFEEISTTDSPQGVISLVRPPSWTLDDLFRGRALLVILDGVQDPGNAGSIVRAAEAFSATGAAFIKGSASPFNSKTLRASAGSLFRVPFVHSIEPEPLIAACRMKKVRLYAAVPREGVLVHDAPLAQPTAFAIGSEGRGVGQAIASAAQGLRIPASGVESLNASLAAGILLYEAAAQRRRGMGP
jgi:RNA methyltransferase, TrmH family